MESRAARARGFTPPRDYDLIKLRDLDFHAVQQVAREQGAAGVKARAITPAEKMPGGKPVKTCFGCGRPNHRQSECYRQAHPDFNHQLVPWASSDQGIAFLALGFRELPEGKRFANAFAKDALVDYRAPAFKKDGNGDERNKGKLLKVNNPPIDDCVTMYLSSPDREEKSCM